MRRVRRTTAGDVRFEMAPLIDVIFLLLTFFVFALMVMVRADTLDIELPTMSAAGESADRNAITVTLTQDGVIRVNGEEVPSHGAEADAAVELGSGQPAWVEAVRRAHEQQPEAAIVLIADERGLVGDLVALFNGLEEAGINARVGLLSSPQGPADGVAR